MADELKIPEDQIVFAERSLREHVFQLQKELKELKIRVEALEQSRQAS